MGTKTSPGTTSLITATAFHDYDQKHEFPYLSTIISTSFDAGSYEAHVTIRQDRQTITRVVPFRFLDPK